MPKGYYPSQRASHIPQTILDDDSDIVSMDVSAQGGRTTPVPDEPSLLTMPSAMQTSSIAMSRDQSNTTTDSMMMANDISTLGDGDDVFTLASGVPPNTTSPGKTTDANSSFAPSPSQRYPDYYANPVETAAPTATKPEEEKPQRRIFGVRLVYVVIALLFVMFLAVAVALTALILSNQDDGSSPSSNSLDRDGTPTNDDGPPLYIPVTDPPTWSPTSSPTRAPTGSPTGVPTVSPVPTKPPSSAPTPAAPTASPSEPPTAVPSASPTISPTSQPSAALTGTPSVSAMPTAAPSSRPTTAPTGRPTFSNVRTQILALMPDETSQSILEPGSSTSIAMEWIEDDASNEDLPVEQLAQRFALASFHFNGAQRRRLQDGQVRGWLQGGVCSWTGVSCNGDGRVSAINVASRDLTGRLVPEWAYLTSLVTINVSRNDLVGPIPAAWGALSNLETLDVSRNDLSGALPSSLSRMQSLRVLNMEFNAFSGNFPSQTLSQIASLRTINAFANDFRGNVSNRMCRRNWNIFTLDCVFEVDCPSGCCTACYFQCGGNTGVACP